MKALILNDRGIWRRDENHTTTISSPVSRTSETVVNQRSQLLYVRKCPNCGPTGFSRKRFIQIRKKRFLNHKMLASVHGCKHAFREAVINAFVHNAWVSGNEPMITVYSDRIEILSRGTLPPSQTMEGFFAGESVPVNRKLSEVFLQLHISEKTGRGVPKITERYGKGAFEFRENAIVVTIPFHWINVMGDKPGDKLGDKSSHTGDRALPFLTETQVGVLAALRDNPNLTKPQLVAMLHRSKTTIDNAIRALREHGLIIRIGSNKTGYWQVTDHQGTES